MFFDIRLLLLPKLFFFFLLILLNIDFNISGYMFENNNYA